MKTGLIVSTHCDDAMFSIGGMIHSNPNDFDKVVTVFGTCAWSRIDGLTDSEEISELNQREEEQVWRELGIDFEINSLPEAMLRGYKIWNLPGKEEPELTNQVQNILKRHIEGYKNLYLPIGIGKHIDHVLVAKQLDVIYNIITKEQTVWLYEDVPYTWWLKGKKTRLEKIKQKYILQPEVFNVSNVMKEKIQSLLKYRTQVSNEDINMVREYSKSLLKKGYGERVWKILGKH